MISLYKIPQPLEQELTHLLQDLDYPSARFYSVKALLDQIMNPMVIIAPIIFYEEVETLPVPMLPISIHLSDIERTLIGVPVQNEPPIIIASKEEIKWLQLENEHDFSIPLQFMTTEDFLASGVQSSRVYLTPIWMKNVFSDPSFTANLRYINPSTTSLLSLLQLASSLIHFTGEITRKRYEVEAIVSSAHDGVIAVDRAGNITVVNEHAKTILRLQGEVKGKKITEFIPQSDMLRVLQTGQVETGDIATVLNRKLVINRFPVIVKEQVVGAVSSFKDITDIQKMEMKLRKMLHQNGLEAKYTLSDIVGESPEIVEVKELAKRFAKTDATVLITGESGTGKELFAQGIHTESTRTLGPFVAVNCAAIPETLLESELFGYEEGAFTGARKGGKTGLFELAHRGTLFLDEIGEMPLRIQALLLRVLQEKTVRRVGGERIIPVDVRIIAATNRKLEKEIERKQFRSDLYHRLNVLALELPPMRERLVDIPLLVEALVAQLNEERETKITQIDSKLLHVFMQYHWPGNIRELRNVVERIMVLEDGHTLSIEGAAFFTKKIKQQMNPEALSIKDREKALISSVLHQYSHNKTLAAKSLGIDRTTLWRKIKEYNL
ncbi:sigma-54 interaction domain-containing protein [Microbacteriaceae bacterium 4G12]